MSPTTLLRLACLLSSSLVPLLAAGAVFLLFFVKLSQRRFLFSSIANDGDKCMVVVSTFSFVHYLLDTRLEDRRIQLFGFGVFLIHD